MQNQKIQDQSEQVQAQLDLIDVLKEKVEAFDKLIEVQGECLTSRYMIGLYNGLVLGRSVITGEEPVFYEQDKEEKE